MSKRCSKTNVCPDPLCVHYERHDQIEGCDRKKCIKDDQIICKCKR